MTKEIGAILSAEGGCDFIVWAPEKEKMQLHIVAPAEQWVDMARDAAGYFTARVTGVQAGCRYFYQSDNDKEQPDPASFYQPEGVHGPSEVIAHDHKWNDGDWRNRPLGDYIIYELHIGTFTGEGTFEAAIAQLDDLVELGINAIEIMPVSQFSGGMNWGYDGVFPYAAQSTYGGYSGLKLLVDACHARGIAVILDVVYNHMGPEGNCLPSFAPYFTEKYCTPWGAAINYDGAWSDGVRTYFCDNALYWLEHYHIDALRLDAVHEMYDFGAIHFWEYLHDEVNSLSQRQGRNFYLIAESDLNNPKIIKHPEAGGYGFNAQWLDDFHHALYVLLYDKGKELYVDFGKMEQLTKAYTDGYVHGGDYVQFRKKKFGKSSAGLPADRFIVFNQNHDQVGNSVDGARLSKLISFDKLKVAAAAILLSPYIPMLFMGEEYGEETPFTYFIDHSDDELVEAVRKGRKKEFENHTWQTDPPDPQDDKTFYDSKLKWALRTKGKHKVLLQWNKDLIALRKTHKALRSMSKNDLNIYAISDSAYALHRTSEDNTEELLAILNLGDAPITHAPPAFAKGWHKLLDSADYSESGNIATMKADVIGGKELNIKAASVVVYSNENINTD